MEMGSLSLFMDVVIMEVLQMKLSLNVHVESVVGAAAYSSLTFFLDLMSPFTSAIHVYFVIFRH